MELLFENETNDFKCYYYKVNFNLPTNQLSLKFSIQISKNNQKNNKILVYNTNTLTWNLILEDNTRYGLYFNKEEISNKYLQNIYKLFL